MHVRAAPLAALRWQLCSASRLLRSTSDIGCASWEPRNAVQAEPWAMPKPSSRKTEPDDSLLLEPSLIALRKALAGSSGAREQPVPLNDTPQLAAALRLARQHVEDTVDAPAVQLIGAGAPAGRG